jgi:hypothetical protein
MEWPFCFVHACGVHKGGSKQVPQAPDQSLVAEIFKLRSWTNLVERTGPDELENLGKLTENVVPVVRVLDGEFAFVENVIEIEKDLGWAIALAEEDLHRCPVSGTTVGRWVLRVLEVGAGLGALCRSKPEIRVMAKARSSSLAPARPGNDRSIEDQAGAGEAGFGFLQLGDVEGGYAEAGGFDAGAGVREGGGEDYSVAEGQGVGGVGFVGGNIEPEIPGERSGVEPGTIGEEDVAAEVGDGGFQVEAAGDGNDDDFVIVRREEGG